MRSTFRVLTPSRSRHGLLSALFLLLFAASVGAQTTTINVPITITHGALLTTFTFVNDTGSTLPAGTPVTMGQGFRYGDIMPGFYPVIVDASTRAVLPGQQWDDVSTWRENGGNGSWRHGVWAIWLPNSLAAGATYQIGFAVASTASQSVQFGTPNPTIACDTPPGTVVTLLNLAPSDGQLIQWSLTGDTGDFAIDPSFPGTAVVVGPSGINPAHCGQANNVVVTGSQP